MTHPQTDYSSGGYVGSVDGTLAKLSYITCYQAMAGFEPTCNRLDY